MAVKIYVTLTDNSILKLYLSSIKIISLKQQIKPRRPFIRKYNYSETDAYKKYRNRDQYCFKDTRNCDPASSVMFLYGHFRPPITQTRIEIIRFVVCSLLRTINKSNNIKINK